MFCPTKFGSAGPAETWIATVLVCGQDVPSAGSVPTTVPTGAVEPTFWVVADRCARCSAAWAAPSVSPATLGTTEVNGPLEVSSLTVVPLATRPDGLVPTTMPLATELLCTWLPVRTVRPSFFSAVAATVTLYPLTEGTRTYRPAKKYQPPSPSPAHSKTTSTTTSRRELNSHRCRKGSRPPCPGRLPPGRPPGCARCRRRARRGSSRPELSCPEPARPELARRELADLVQAGARGSGPGKAGRAGSASNTLTAGRVPVVAHQPFVTAGVSSSSQGASLMPWTPAPARR